MAILSCIWQKIGKICTSCKLFHRLLSKSAQRAPKNFEYGGNQWVDEGGGIRIFLMGGAGLHWVAKGPKGGGGSLWSPWLPFWFHNIIGCSMLGGVADGERVLRSNYYRKEWEKDDVSKFTLSYCDDPILDPIKKSTLWKNGGGESHLIPLP